MTTTTQRPTATTERLAALTELARVLFPILVTGDVRTSSSHLL